MKYELNREKQRKLIFEDLNFGELFVWKNANKDSVAIKVKIRQTESLRDYIKDGYAYLDDGSCWIIGGKYSKLASDSVIRVTAEEIIFNTVSS